MKKLSTLFSAEIIFLAVFCIISAPSQVNAQGNWTQKADFGGAARDGAAGFAIGNKGYIGTGQVSTNIGSKDFWEYDVSNNTWTQKADVGGLERWDPFYFAINGKGYIGTGLTSSGYIKDFWEYDPTVNTWIQKPDFGGAARQGAISFVINGIAYAGTGYSSIYRSDFWKYDPSLNQWVQVAAFGGVPRSDARGFAINNKGYVGTGWNGTAFKDFWEYEPSSDIWVQKSDFPGAARSSGFAFSIGSKGFYGTGGDGTYNYKDFWEYNPTTDTWLQKIDFPGPVSVYSVGFSIGGKGYVGTGWDSLNNYYNDFYEFSDSCNALNITLIPGNVSCIGSNDGSVNANVSGGNTPYTYLWSDSSITQTITGLAPGIYSVTINDAIGCTTNSSVNITQPDPGVWSPKANFGGTARHSAVAFSIGAKGYLGTGYDGTIKKDFWEWDQTTNVWTQKADFGGTARFGATGVAIGAKGYVGLGTTSYPTYTFVKDFWEFNPSSNTWTQKTQFPGPGRYTLVGLSIGNKGYFGTGWDQVTPFYNDWYEYNPTNDTWTQKTAFAGTSRNSASSFVINNKGYVGAGYDGTIRKDFWEYDPSSDSWAQKADFGGTPRYSAAAFTINNMAYLGLGSIGYPNIVLVKDFWKYDPYLNTWTQIGDFAGTARQQTSVFSIGNYGYVGTGSDGVVKNELWEFGPSCNNLSIALNKTDVSCYGDSNGTVSATIAGGNSPYLYSWSNGDSTSNLTGISAGTYSVTVYDNYGFYSSDSIIVSQPLPLALSSIVTNVTCYADSNGAMNLTVSGGISPYSYLWSNGEATEDIANIAAGSYEVTITDNNNCSSTLSYNISEPAQMTLSTGTTTATCGLSNGTASASASGGTSPYTYSWSNSMTSSAITGLAAGVYTVTTMDFNACSVSQIVNVSNTVPVITISSNDVTCNGGNNGSSVITATGGTTPYSYSWSNGSASDTITGITAGTYTASVTDASGCLAIISDTIYEPSVLTATTSSTDVLCNGNSEGSVDVTATGGTSPYAYLWSNGGAGTTENNLATGNYSVTVTDNNGCTASASATVNEPSLLSASATSTDVLCNGSSDGSASITVSGGTSPYTYLWSGSGTGTMENNLAAGNYSVTVTDNNGCIASASATVNEPSLLSASATSTDVLCNGSSNGSASVTALGGTSPYTYLWSSSGMGITENNLAAGNYSVSVTDNNGCTASASATVNEPSLLSASATSTDALCNGSSDGSASITASGGTSPYTYLWSGSGTGTIENNLAAGNYSVTVTDNNGCTASASATVNEPSLLSASATSTDVLCNGSSDGSANVTASGGTSPYTYLWNTGVQTQNIASLPVGNYSVTVTDNNGCSASSSAAINEPSSLSASSVSTDALCNGSSNGSASVTASGGTSPYTYLWFGSGTGSTENNLAAGNYSVTVTDNNGCTASASATVNEPSSLSVSASSMDALCNGSSNGSASVTASGGTSPYTYLWSGSGTGATENNLAAGNYFVTVTDNNGCTVSASATVNEPSVISVNLNIAICQGDSIFAGGSYQIASGSYYDTLSASNGCDSILTTNLTVNMIYSANVNVTICPGDSLFAGGNYQTTPGNYYDTLTSLNGCDSIIVTNLAVNAWSNVISGTIFYYDSPITSGVVKLIQKNGNSPQSMVDMDSMLVNPDGTYLFDNIPPGNYLVKALGDTGMYSNVATYADSSNHWQDATNINFGVNCGDTIANTNVYLIDFSTTIGFGNIHGSVVNGGPGKIGSTFMGDPVPGIDITLEQIPGGIAVGFTKTDNNGEFSFNNVELGDYRIYVDIPGYVMDTVSVISYDSTNINLDYELKICVFEDSVSATIQVCDMAYLTISEVENISGLSIFPNPSSGKMFVSFYSKAEEIISMELVNNLGQIVQKKLVKVNTGNNKVENDMEKLSNGIYSLKLVAKERTVINKVIINK